MSKFTPGPWKTMDDDCVYAMNTLTRIGHILGRSREEQDANVRLIAAAPEMYELLQTIYDEAPILVGNSELDDFVAAIHEIGSFLARIDGEAEQ